MNISIKRIQYNLPNRVEIGSDLLEDNPDWRIDDIQEKTGIFNRYIADKKETSMDLAVKAAEKIFKNGDKKDEIDGVIFISQTSEYSLPSTACIIQDKLELGTSTMAFDINLGCSGFVYGLSVAGSLIESNMCKNILILCSDTYTKYINKKDRTCRPIFSDAAAAILVSKSNSNDLGPFCLGTDGSGYDNLIVANSGINFEKNTPPELYMNGANVFMFTLSKVPLLVNSLLAKANKSISEVDYFAFHQASKVVLDNIARQLEIPQKKCLSNIENIGNTVSASIPILLKDASLSKQIKKGDLVMLVGFGVGYSWGACLLEWSSIE